MHGPSQRADRLTSQNVLVSGIEKELAKPGTRVLDASLQVFPNPLRGKAKIMYTLSETQEIDMSVFDVRGAKVAGLASGTAAKNTLHSAVWEPKAAPAGIYILRLRLAAKTLTKKLLLVK